MKSVGPLADIDHTMKSALFRWEGDQEKTAAHLHQDISTVRPWWQPAHQVPLWNHFLLWSTNWDYILLNSQIPSLWVSNQFSLERSFLSWVFPTRITLTPNPYPRCLPGLTAWPLKRQLGSSQSQLVASSWSYFALWTTWCHCWNTDKIWPLLSPTLPVQHWLLGSYPGVARYAHRREVWGAMLVSHLWSWEPWPPNIFLENEARRVSQASSCP